MSYALPQNGPTQRQHGDNWAASGRSRFPGEGDANGGIADKVSGIFGGDKSQLPMYKDKPYAYPVSSRRLPWFRRKRVMGLVLGCLAGLSWWFGILSPLSYVSLGDGSSMVSRSSWRSKTGPASWEQRAEQVRDVFKTSWAGYEKYAMGDDEFQPIKKTSRKMTPDGMGWIIVDALDTMMLMNLTTELSSARQWIHTNLTYDQDHAVNTFETTIRMLGGLLSAHYLSTGFPGIYAPVDDDLSDDMYVEKAADLADRLMGAYESKSGVPFASVNLHSMKGIPSHDDGGASSTAEATSVQLEMKYLSKLTGETHYWEGAERVMKVVDDNNAKDGLLPIFIYADKGQFRGANIRLGSRGDSYYEYLIKQYLQTSEQEPVYQELWKESLEGVKKHLITYSSPSNFTVLAERPQGLDKPLTAKMDHLVCFLPGTIALGVTNGKSVAEARKQPNWGPEQEEDLKLAEELMKTCWGMYKVTPTGLAPEIAHFNIHDPPLMYNDFNPTDLPKSPEDFSEHADVLTGKTPIGKDDYIIKPSDSHNLQRPETVESLFYMWRITGDEKYREWGWDMFQSFVQWTAVEDGTGYSSLQDVTRIPPVMRDNMESFWLAETLKYFYLLFSPSTILPLEDVVFNTEAHAFPRFELSKLLQTGWKRKPRDEKGNIIGERTSIESEVKQGVEGGEVKVRTVEVTKTRPEETLVVEAAAGAGAAGEGVAAAQAAPVEQTPEVAGAPIDGAEILG
ncbi:hypothetical protein MBLNU230_g8654t1 [Neophaeotheca triangularis]